MSEKEIERIVLNETLAIARQRGGESRRNVDRISGEIIEGERPDFVVISNKSIQDLTRVVAIEHFRVDHFSELNVRNGHQDSLAAIEKKRADKVQQMWHPTSFDADIPPNVLDAVSTSFAKCLEAKFKASYGGYIKSFVDGLHKHVAKLDSYRENVKNRAPYGAEIEMALLIELHSDFSGSFVHVDGKCHKAIAGELLLFDEMIVELANLRGTVDYVIVGSYEALKSEIVDAAVVRPAMLYRSIERNKLQVFEYLGEDKERPVYSDTRITPSATLVEDRIDFELERESQGMTMAEHLEACLSTLPKVLGAHQEHQPFLTTIAMQMLLEMYSDALPHKALITWNDIDAARRQLGQDEITRRESRFEERWFPNQKR